MSWHKLYPSLQTTLFHSKLWKAGPPDWQRKSINRRNRWPTVFALALDSAVSGTIPSHLSVQCFQWPRHPPPCCGEVKHKVRRACNFRKGLITPNSVFLTFCWLPESYRIGLVAKLWQLLSCVVFLTFFTFFLREISACVHHSQLYMLTYIS